LKLLLKYNFNIVILGLLLNYEKKSAYLKISKRNFMLLSYKEERCVENSIRNGIHNGNVNIG